PGSRGAHRRGGPGGPVRGHDRRRRRDGRHQPVRRRRGAPDRHGGASGPRRRHRARPARRRRLRRRPARRCARRRCVVMRAVRVHAHGEPADVARVEDTDAPEPGPGQVVIAVGGAALNLPDVLLCRGTYALHPPLPFTPGLDVAGTVVAVGEGTDPSLVGRAVAGVAELPYGALAERSLLAADRLYPVPEGVSAGAAAAMLIAFTTAHVSLIRRAGLVAGETLLVLGGAGGVGTAAIQVGKVLGAR